MMFWFRGAWEALLLRRAVLLVALVTGSMVGLQASALAAERSGTATEDDWRHVQPWGDWCNFDPDTAEGHSTPQSYSATTTTEWSVDDSGRTTQEVNQIGVMTADGVTRPFRATLTTSGPVTAYLHTAPLQAGEDYLAPRFFDESLDVDYVWTVPDYYVFEYHTVAGDGTAATYGPTFCG
jgi:hypothetical protein